MKTNRSVATILSDMDPIPKTTPFTPVMPDGTRLTGVTRGDITVLEGTLMSRKRGLHATVLIGDVTYNVFGASCGAQCFCDARLEVVSPAGGPR